MEENIIIIGSSHIAKQSLEEVENIILKEKPDIVAIELDKKRLLGILSGQKHKPQLSDIKRYGLQGFLFNLIGGWAERKLGEMVGVPPGSEMILAHKTAKKIGAKTALIDQDIEITMKRLSQEFKFKEKMQILKDIIKSIFFKKRELKKLGIQNIDLTKVPPKKLIEKLIEKLKKDYPGLYKVLIQERNQYMAQQLIRIQQENPDKKIVAVVGAGHEKGLRELIRKKNKITFTYSIG